jgi:hypothetical protein
MDTDSLWILMYKIREMNFPFKIKSLEFNFQNEDEREKGCKER